MTDGTTHYTRPDVAMFLAFLNAQEGPKMEELPPAEAREIMGLPLRSGVRPEFAL